MQTSTDIKRFFEINCLIKTISMLFWVCFLSKEANNKNSTSFIFMLVHAVSSRAVILRWKIIKLRLCSIIWISLFLMMIAKNLFLRCLVGLTLLSSRVLLRLKLYLQCFWHFLKRITNYLKLRWFISLRICTDRKLGCHHLCFCVWAKVWRAQINK